MAHADRVLERFKFRAGELYEGIVGLALEVSDAGEGVGWAELLERVDPGDRWSERSIDGAVRDLMACGFLGVSGRPGHARRPDSRVLRVTPLGRAALEGRVGVLPWRVAPDGMLAPTRELEGWDGVG